MIARTSAVLPFLLDYLKAQAASGHTAHYLKLFEKHRAEHLDAQRRENAPTPSGAKE